MSFLNLALAFGAAAFAIPLLIHLLTRSRYQQVDWGAMHLLDEAISINSRKMRLEQWLLLLLRCLIPVILALCLARPVLTGGRVLTGDAPSSLVVVLDDSYSMEVGEGTNSRFEEARSAAKSIMESAAAGSEVSVITTGGNPRSLSDEPLLDISQAVQNVNNLSVGSGANRIATALDAGFTTLAKMKQANRRLVILSDFQSRDWKSLDGSVFDEIAGQVKSLPVQPKVSCLPIGPRSATVSNVAIESLELSRHWLGVGQSLEIRVNMRNHGADSVNAMPLKVFVDGKEITEKKVSLAARSTGQMEFVTEFESPGSHYVHVAIAAKDTLITDNARYVEITVLPKLSVLLVDGDRRGEPLMSDTDYLSIALAPFAFGGVNAVDAFKTTTIRPEELNDNRLKEINSVALANAQELNGGQLDLLQRFVESGGCLLVFPGNRIRRDWYNQSMFKNGNGLLPAKFGEFKGKPDSSDLANRIADQSFQHPALELFNRNSASELRGAEIRAWQLLETPEVANATEVANQEGKSLPPSVLMRLESGEPFLIERKVGKGTVFQFAICCDADWSDLPTQPIYLPLMQQLIAQSLADLGPNRNVVTGERLVSVLKEEHQSKNYSVITPAGFKHSLKPVTVEGTSQLEFSQTQRPGLYQMKIGEDQVVNFCVTSPASESELELLSEDELKGVADRLAAKQYATKEELLAMQKEEHFGREIWHWLLYGLLGLMFGELVLQQWFTRGSS